MKGGFDSCLLWERRFWSCGWGLRGIHWCHNGGPLPSIHTRTTISWRYIEWATKNVKWKKWNALPPRISGTSVCLQFKHWIGVEAAFDWDARDFLTGTGSSGLFWLGCCSVNFFCAYGFLWRFVRGCGVGPCFSGFMAYDGPHAWIDDWFNGAKNEIYNVPLAVVLTWAQAAIVSQDIISWVGPTRIQ